MNSDRAASYRVGGGQDPPKPPVSQVRAQDNDFDNFEIDVADIEIVENVNQEKD